MSVVTVRAQDTFEAMEMVAQKLGPDALILSCKNRNGMIEIVASDDAPISANTPAKPANAVMVDPLPDTGPDIGPDVGPDMGPEPVPDPMAPTAPSVDIEISDDAPRRASFAEQFQAETSRVDVRDLVDTDMVLNAPRVVLVGPAGAGKSLVAMQLAAQMLELSPNRSLRFGYCGAGSRADAAYLAQKAKLLGVDMTYVDPRNFSDMKRGHSDVVVVSGKGAEGPLQAAALGVPMGARTVLVLPAGLRADRIAYEIKRWATPGMGVIFTCEPAFPPDGKDFEEVKQAGVTRLWTSFNDRIVAGLVSSMEPSVTKAKHQTSQSQGENT